MWSAENLKQLYSYFGDAVTILLTILTIQTETMFNFDLDLLRQML